MKKTISIITPCYNEEQGIEECYRTVRHLFESQLAAYRREHIFCDNASTDRTPEILKKLAAHDPDIKVIINSRNFGILRNTYNGVMSASGDAVLLFLPADLQDPPELIPEFVGRWEQGYEVVYGVRSEREEPFLLRTARKAYYRVISRFSDIEYPPDVGDFQLVDRKVVEAMKSFHEVQPFMRMMTFECGFRSTGIPYRWRARKHGRSRNRLTQLVDQGLTGLISFSTVPTRLALVLGAIIAAVSLLVVVGVVIARLVFGPYAPRGTFAIISAIFFFGGTQLLFTGLLGEYILAIFNHARRRPMVVERERINFEDEGS